MKDHLRETERDNADEPSFITTTVEGATDKQRPPKMKSPYEVKPMLVLVRKHVRAWCGTFLLAAGHVWKQVLTALGIFLFLLSLKAGLLYSLDESTFWGQLYSHITVGFAVSAIVIFAFEWGSEVKQTLNMTGMLANALNQHIDTVLNASSREAIGRAMGELLGDSNGARFTRHFHAFADSITHFDRADWAASGYLDFVEWSQQETTRFARELAHLSENIMKDADSKTEFRLVLHDATDPIDVMLAGITSAMGEAGTYYAISDVFTWTKLTKFRKAQTAALNSGLKIRRIFVIGKDSDFDVAAAEMRSRMYSHYDDATTSNCKYQIKLISDRDVQSLASPLLLKTHHFGIFQPSENRKLPLIVQVLDANLLSFRIAGASEASAVLEAFNNLWDELQPITPDGEECRLTDKRSAASDAPPPSQHGDSTNPLRPPSAETVAKPDVGRNRIRDYLMAYRVKQLDRAVVRKDILYRGISDIAAWASGSFNELETAIADAVKYSSKVKHGVIVRRLFAFNGTTLPTKDVLAILQRHHNIAIQAPANYAWRVIQRAAIPEEVSKRIPFALFEDGSGHSDIDVALGENETFRFGVAKHLTDILEEGFELLWNDSGYESLAASIRTSFPTDVASAILTSLDGASPANASPERDSSASHAGHAAKK